MPESILMVKINLLYIKSRDMMQKSRDFDLTTSICIFFTGISKIAVPT